MAKKKFRAPTISRPDSLHGRHGSGTQYQYNDILGCQRELRAGTDGPQLARPEHMAPRLRIVGVLIVVLGLAVCYGAVTLWPRDAWLSVGGALRIVGSLVAGVLGVLNVVSGVAVLLIRSSD